jgi:hypothetical protein
MPDVAGSRSRVRQRRAREAALAVAPDLGVDARHATILEDWNNTIIRLAPAQIVAKVGTSHFRDARLESLERELAVAKHLAARNAPVVRPTEDVPAGPHRRHGLALTLWQYVVPVPGATVTPARRRRRSRSCTRPSPTSTERSPASPKSSKTLKAYSGHIARPPWRPPIAGSYSASCAN